MRRGRFRHRFSCAAQVENIFLTVEEEHAEPRERFAPALRECQGHEAQKPLTQRRSNDTDAQVFIRGYRSR